MGALLALLCWWAAFSHPDPSELFYAVISLVPALLISFMLAIRNRCERISLEGDEPAVAGTRLFAGTVLRVPVAAIDVLSLAQMANLDGYNSQVKLNLLQKAGTSPERIMLAKLMHPDDKAKVLDGLAAFFEEAGIHVKIRDTRRHGDAPWP